MHRRDEVITNRGRHALAEGIHLLCGSVVPHPRFRDICLHLAGIRRCKSIDMILIAFIETAERMLTEGTVLRSLQQDEVRTVQLMLLARTVLHRIEEEVRIL